MSARFPTYREVMERVRADVAAATGLGDKVVVSPPRVAIEVEIAALPIVFLIGPDLTPLPELRAHATEIVLAKRIDLTTDPRIAEYDFIEAPDYYDLGFEAVVLDHGARLIDLAVAVQRALGDRKAKVTVGTDDGASWAYRFRTDKAMGQLAKPNLTNVRSMAGQFAVIDVPLLPADVTVGDLILDRDVTVAQDVGGQEAVLAHEVIPPPPAP